MQEYLLLFIAAIFVNNIVLAQYLGNCPFIGTSKDMGVALGMGAAVVFVSVMAAAITWGAQRYLLDPFGLAGLDLTFEEADPVAFPCLRLGYEAGRLGGSAPAVLNAADEIAVQAFLERRIGFTSIAAIVEQTLETVDLRPLDSVEEVLAADREARDIAHALAGGSC